jgi:hypothetical protein
MRARWKSRAIGTLAAFPAILAPLVPAGEQRMAAPLPGGERAAVSPALHVIPFPNTPDASPRSQIIFSALKPSDLAARPLVTGSTSGPHMGRLLLLPDHAGTAFLPTQPFSAGEKVSVTAVLRSPQDGTASGDPGARSLSFSFTVAVPAPAVQSRRNRAGGSSPPRRGPFHSRPSLDPPPVHVSPGPAPGARQILLSPDAKDSSLPFQSGLMILSHAGQLVWFRPVRAYAVNLEVQRYRGQRVLTWWQGHKVPNDTVDGQDVIVNQSYRRVAAVRAGWGYDTNRHDFQITPQGTALVLATFPVKLDLSSLGGLSSVIVLDCIIQEVDIGTGQVLWEWHSLGHVPLDASHRLVRSSLVDPYHLNSAQQLPGHRLLISSRNTWSAYEINELTGRVIWTLGGRYSSFKMGPGTHFEWQHDPHLYGHGLLSVFDDGASPQEEPQSSAKELRLNYKTRTASLVKRFTHTPPLLASVEGSAQLLSNDDMFVGWGSEPDFSEYTPAGRQVFNGSFPLGVRSYRAYRLAWTGHPSAPPALAESRRDHGTVWLYASWNGATQIARWRILGGAAPDRLRPLKSRPWNGFETFIAIPRAPRYLEAQALSPHGKILGHTRTARTR